MAKSGRGSRFHLISLSLSLSNMVVVRHKQQFISMQMNMNLLIRIIIDITFKHRIDTIELRNTPIARENFRGLYLRIK
jgi:hypothetical protein